MKITISELFYDVNNSSIIALGESITHKYESLSEQLSAMDEDAGERAHSIVANWSNEHFWKISDEILSRLTDMAPRSIMGPIEGARQRWRNRLYFSLVSQCNEHLIKAYYLADQTQQKYVDFLDPEECTYTDIFEFRLVREFINRWEIENAPQKRKGRIKCNELAGIDEALFMEKVHEVYYHIYGITLEEENGLVKKENRKDKHRTKINHYLMAFVTSIIGGAKEMVHGNVVKHACEFIQGLFEDSLELVGVRQWQNVFGILSSEILHNSSRENDLRNNFNQLVEVLRTKYNIVKALFLSPIPSTEA